MDAVVDRVGGRQGSACHVLMNGGRQDRSNMLQGPLVLFGIVTALAGSTEVDPAYSSTAFILHDQAEFHRLARFTGSGYQRELSIFFEIGYSRPSSNRCHCFLQEAP